MLTLFNPLKEVKKQGYAISSRIGLPYSPLWPYNLKEGYYYPHRLDTNRLISHGYTFNGEEWQKSNGPKPYSWIQSWFRLDDY